MVYLLFFIILLRLCNVRYPEGKLIRGLWVGAIEMEGEAREGRSLSETPTWAVATVITVMVASGFFFQGSLKRCGKVKKKK